ncbi:unnamed protein product [Heligmosomoides polygyrus]|uniref:Uncharacterized protein n=1 Tax=Heligmosomoides polygyrus TaxID=6339 RepID=A0A183F1U8_HELPZ|nr:unnamed protein product [Heligmosomoides polygyrus]
MLQAYQSTTEETTKGDGQKTRREKKSESSSGFVQTLTSFMPILQWLPKSVGVRLAFASFRR